MTVNLCEYSSDPLELSNTIKMLCLYFLSCNEFYVTYGESVDVPVDVI